MSKVYSARNSSSELGGDTKRGFNFEDLVGVMFEISSVTVSSFSSSSEASDIF